MSNLSAPPFPADTWAEVRTRDRVMRYRRSGTGASVVLLQAAGEPDALWPELGDELASRFRLIVPDPPGAGTDVAGWLADFLEGLGLTGIAVIASSAFCIPALELALLGAGQVRRIVLVPDGSAAETGLGGTLETTARDVAELLVVRRGSPSDDAVVLIGRFLAAEG